MGLFGILTVSHILLWVIASLSAYLIYIILIQPFLYWKLKGVKTSRIVPLFGDEIFRKYFGKESYAKVIQNIYNEAQNSRYIAFCQFGKPLLLINCPELIRQLFVKDADHFTDHRNAFDEISDKIIPRTMVYLKGQEWKDVRSIWNPFLTSNRIGKMYPILCETIDFSMQKFMEQNKDVVDFEIRQTFQIFAGYLGASTYFGISPNSDGNEMTNFLLNIVRSFPHREGNFWINLKFCLTALFPSMSWLTGYRSIITQNAQSHYFETVKNRVSREKNVHRPDMIGTWIEMREEEDDSCDEDLKKRRIMQTDEEITCQLCMFLFSSLDGLATTMKFITYELAKNQDVQKKLIEEVDETIKIEGSTPSYNTMMGLPYMDMVINESMRKWPAVINLDRICTKSYTIQPKSPGETTLQIEEGDVVMVPLFALHHDPMYFPNPEKFDPERFSPENRDKIKPYTYMPWGVGPRNCNGIKLSTLMMKTLFFRILTNFEIVCTEKTIESIELQGSRVTTEDEVFLGLKRRNKH